jgi:hypothetical protein
MMEKHTPGPWYLKDVIEADGRPVCKIMSDGQFVAYVHAHQRNVANARLVAAAPDLLEALTVLTDNIVHAFPALASLGPVTAARDAIAKATPSDPLLQHNGVK